MGVRDDGRDRKGNKDFSVPDLGKKKGKKNK